MLSVEQNNRVCLIRLERPPVNALDREKLAAITAVIPMSELLGRATDILAGQVRGRVVVDVNR